jgi:signal transduction histidine kinase
MRSRLAASAAAVTFMVVIAFVLPLGFVVHVLAVDRATGNAQLEAQSLADGLATVPDLASVGRMVDQANARHPHSASIVLADGQVLGVAVKPDRALGLARQGRAFTATGAGGRVVLVPVRTADGKTSVVRVMVPSALLTQGVGKAWLALGVLGVVLVLISVFLADWLARSLVRPIRSLAVVTGELERGELAARVEPAGPPEIAAVGHAVNQLAARIGELLAKEREANADLSHRLRTPLTALRLDAEALADSSERLRLIADADAVEAAVNQLIREARHPEAKATAAAGDLVATVRRRLAFWTALARAQKRPYQINLPEGGLPVAASESDLSAAVDTIVANVFAHTGEGTGFSVVVDRAAPVARLVVEDDGPGFPPGMRLRRGRSGAGSTGLGLDIARGVAVKSGGRIRLIRRANGGARVELHFGLTSPNVAEAEISTERMTHGWRREARA